MAHLKNGQVRIDTDRNLAPRGLKTSAYFTVGGTSEEYRVTITDGSGPHWCEHHDGKMCFGNNGKGKNGKYGHPNQRNTDNPLEWCKHVKSVLALPHVIAEAFEIRQTGALSQHCTVPITSGDLKRRLDRSKAPAAKEIASAGPLTDAETRLAELETETEALRKSIANAKSEKLRKELSELIKEHGFAAVEQAVNDV